MDWPD